jgi:diguanylate cyclase (GGDEF)-like protein
MARVASIFPLGITARLSISFLAVAALAAAANLIALENVSIILWNTPTSAPSPPQSQVPAVTVRTKAPVAPRQLIAEKARHDALAVAVDRYERATLTRADAKSLISDREFDAALDSLRSTAHDYFDGSAARAPVAAPIATYINGGQFLIRVADERRDARVEHSNLANAMNDRMQASLDRAWRIFGKVIGRQSLVQMRTEFEAVRRHSQKIAAGELLDSNDLDALTASERDFLQTLTENQSKLIKSEGIDWVNRVHADFEELIERRTTLATLNTQYNDALRTLSQYHLALFAAMNTATANAAAAVIAAPERKPTPLPVDRPNIIPSPAPAAMSAFALTPAPLFTPAPMFTPAPLYTPAPSFTSVPLSASVPLGSSMPLGSSIVTPAAAEMLLPPRPLANEMLTETAIRNADHHARNVMAAVTTIVLLLVTAISILTVRSVVRPVRRILRGSSEIAAGNARIQVIRGGVRELDTLAAAFNDMAARLAAAQDASRIQQETLEETVRERTQELQMLAQQDPLTSLPNRRHLSALLNDAIRDAAIERRYIGVYFLDIDNFKNFNDSLGHVFGDRVLMSVANRLEEMADGIGFVARLGGDEFTVVFESADSEYAIQSLGLRLVQAFQRELSVDDRELSVSVSVGASIFPDHGDDAEGLLRAADSALFRAKELGRSRLALFTPELIESAAARFSIEQGLRRALEREEFELLYQPEIDLATMEVGLVEALLRWRMPDGRLARPGEFLAIAEQSSLISDLNRWVLRTAVAAASNWRRTGWPAARVAINISPRQLLDPRFTEFLLALLREFRLPPEAIELELTETVMQTGSTTIDSLRGLHSCGFGIALDDFGTGYSSLTSLEQLPLSRIKLDRSLIASIDSSARSAAIARAIIELCSGLELEVTAEGVERPTQLAWLFRLTTSWHAERRWCQSFSTCCCRFRQRHTYATSAPSVPKGSRAAESRRSINPVGGAARLRIWDCLRSCAVLVQ